MDTDIIANERTGARMPSWVIHSSTLSVHAKVVYTTLSVNADSNGRCQLGKSRLAQLIGCSKRTVDRAIDELSDGGAIVIERESAPDGAPRANSYLLCVNPPA